VDSTSIVSEEYRHRCEVRWLIAQRVKMGPSVGIGWLQKYLRSKHVKTRRASLEMDIKKQFRLGNRGQYDIWFR